ncbi:MAG: AglZ/HisF2 family acetamidino modification protein [Victivallales bacterium]|nr:AglZ/HisF2 family acetamidino modification protein [Victivallales bacterium]
MLHPRIIPCLLVHDHGLVKTVKFKNPKYVGDPLNAVKIFNEKAVDELLVLDIDAAVRDQEPDYALIEHLAAECRMPLAYGGGIKTLKQAEKVFALGVEKVAISSAAIQTPELVGAMAASVGTQSVVVVLDVKKRLLGGRYDVWIHNGHKNTRENPVDLARKMQDSGAGEIVINSIDNDGVMKTYDFELIDRIREVLDIPLTVLGGAGSLDAVRRLIARYGIIGAAAGSLFVFKGIYRAVLINYPNREAKDVLIAEAWKQYLEQQG